MRRFETLMKITVLLCLSFALSNSLLGQTTITSTQAGAWTTNGTWVGSVAPGTTNLANNVTINHSVTLTSDLTLSGSSSLTITINSGGTLNVNPSGNFTVTGGWGSSATLTFIVKSGGSLKLNGTSTNQFQGYSYIVVQSGGTLTASGTTDFINNGFLTVQSTPTSVSFATLQVDYNNASANTVTINSGATVSATTLTIGNNSTAILVNSGTLNVSGSVTTTGVLTNSGTLTVGGNFTANNSGSQLTTSSGNLTISGNANAFGLIQLNPGASANSEMVVNGSLAVTANDNMRVGTGSTCASSTYYADLVVKTDVNLTGSGDITVYSNGRLVVFGNINGSTSSGTLVTLNCAGQAYVNGNINLGTGGGNTVTNNNSASSPTGSNGSPIIGLYVNGTTTAQTTSGTIGTKSQLQSNDLPFFNYIAGLSGSPLPVTLMFFKASVTNLQAVELEWATANELNFDHFVVERSADGKNFEAITTITGHGTTSVRHDYSYTDNFPLAGISYYRLQSVDFDGYTEIFSSVAVKNEAGKTVHVFPVPVENAEINVFFNFELTEDATLVVLDLSGQEIERTNLKSGESIYHVESTAKTGVYLLKIYSSEINLLQRIAVK